MKNPEHIVDRFDYDPATGVLTWKIARAHRVGTRAGKVTKGAKKGYRIISPGRGVQINASRLIWRIMTGGWPEHEIDHINGVRDDDRWENLRAASRSENCRNRHIHRRNKTGVVGVWFDAKRGTYRATGTIDRVVHHIAMSKDFDEVVAALEKWNDERGFVTRRI